MILTAITSLIEPPSDKDDNYVKSWKELAPTLFFIGFILLMFLLFGGMITA